MFFDSFLNSHKEKKLSHFIGKEYEQHCKVSK